MFKLPRQLLPSLIVALALLTAASALAGPLTTGAEFEFHAPELLSNHESPAERLRRTARAAFDFCARLLRGPRFN